MAYLMLRTLMESHWKIIRIDQCTYYSSYSSVSKSFILNLYPKSEKIKMYYLDGSFGLCLLT